jgi:hypothetical protein
VSSIVMTLAHRCPGATKLLASRRYQAALLLIVTCGQVPDNHAVLRMPRVKSANSRSNCPFTFDHNLSRGAVGHTPTCAAGAARCRCRPRRSVRSLLGIGVLLLVQPLPASRALAGQEHARTMPLGETRLCNASTFWQPATYSLREQFCPRAAAQRAFGRW